MSTTIKLTCQLFWCVDVIFVNHYVNQTAVKWGIDGGPVDRLTEVLLAERTGESAERGKLEAPAGGLTGRARFGSVFTMKNWNARFLSCPSSFGSFFARS